MHDSLHVFIVLIVVSVLSPLIGVSPVYCSGDGGSGFLGVDSVLLVNSTWMKAGWYGFGYSDGFIVLAKFNDSWGLAGFGWDGGFHSFSRIYTSGLLYVDAVYGDGYLYVIGTLWINETIGDRLLIMKYDPSTDTIVKYRVLNISVSGFMFTGQGFMVKYYGDRLYILTSDLEFGGSIFRRYLKYTLLSMDTNLDIIWAREFIIDLYYLFGSSVKPVSAYVGVLGDRLYLFINVPDQHLLHIVLIEPASGDVIDEISYGFNMFTGRTGFYKVYVGPPRESYEKIFLPLTIEYEDNRYYGLMIISEEMGYMVFFRASMGDYMFYKNMLVSDNLVYLLYIVYQVVDDIPCSYSTVYVFDHDGNPLVKLASEENIVVLDILENGSRRAFLLSGINKTMANYFKLESFRVSKIVLYIESKRLYLKYNILEEPIESIDVQLNLTRSSYNDLVYPQIPGIGYISLILAYPVYGLDRYSIRASILCDCNSDLHVILYPYIGGNDLGEPIKYVFHNNTFTIHNLTMDRYLMIIYCGGENIGAWTIAPSELKYYILEPLTPSIETNINDDLVLNPEASFPVIVNINTTYNVYDKFCIKLISNNTGSTNIECIFINKYPEISSRFVGEFSEPGNYSIEFYVEYHGLSIPIRKYHVHVPRWEDIISINISLPEIMEPLKLYRGEIVVSTRSSMPIELNIKFVHPSVIVIDKEIDVSTTITSEKPYIHRFYIMARETGNDTLAGYVKIYVNGRDVITKKVLFKIVSTVSMEKENKSTTLGEIASIEKSSIENPWILLIIVLIPLIAIIPYIVHRRTRRIRET